ncbi:MAG: two-component regulator propeller domain-containing protein [Flavobacteriales bacterium]
MTSCKSQNSTGQSDLIQKENLSISGDTVDALGSSIMTVFQDRNNVLWFGSWETGVYRYDGSTLINFNTTHGLPSNRIDEIKEDGMGNVYLVSCSPQSSIVRIDGRTFKTMKTTPSNDWKLVPNDIWFRHEYGKEKVYRFDGNVIHELTVPKPPDFNNPYEIYSIYTDSKGNVWFGTNPLGVCRFDGHSFNWITEEDVTEFRNEGANGVRSITEDVNGDFWFNTENLYSIYDSTTVNSNRFYTRHESIGGLDGKPNSNLDEYLSTVMDNDKNLWFVTYRDGVWKYDGKNIQQYKVQVNAQDITLFSIYKDNSGTLWLGSHENGAFRFNGESFESFLNWKQTNFILA